MRILIVDDEPAVANNVAAYLRPAGYTVDIATSGKEALAIPTADLQDVQLTIIDVAMWPMTGTQVAEALRAIKPDICVLFVSGGAGVPMLSTAHFKERCWGFLEKPFHPRQLLDAIERLLEMRRLVRSA